MKKILVSGFECYRCTHQWVPEDPKRPPTVCPHCKSPYWMRPRKVLVKTKVEKVKEK
jgi:hypothetical protein